MTVCRLRPWSCVSNFPEEHFWLARRQSDSDIRRNRDNLAAVLGFVGRVVRGKRKKRWLADVLKQAGEKADYIEVFD